MGDAWVSVAESIERIAGVRYDRLTDEDKTECDYVLEAAGEWAAGTLPLEVFAKVGTIQSPFTGRESAGYSRYVALLSVPVTDPRRDALRRAIDGLLRFQGFVITAQGMFEPSEIPDVPIVYRRAA
jgi:hypothetical protein